MTPSIYILVEESARELTGKTLVAAIAARRGFSVVIGQQWLLIDNLMDLPPGLILFKGNNGVQHRNMKRAKRAGHMVASIEEEALIVIDETELRRLYDTGVNATCDLFLAHGRAQADLLSAWFPGINARVVVTGNPRIDLFRPEFLKRIHQEAARIRDEYGRYILFNLNYGTINSGYGDVLGYFDACVSGNIYNPRDSADDRLFGDLVQWENDNLAAMAQAIARLDRDLPSIGMVVRPHPSERLEVWQQALLEHPRVAVVRAGSHLPWTLASEIMVHTSCTTGAEAYLAGHAALSLCPSENALTKGFLSNLVNPVFRTAAAACDHIINRLDGHTAPTEADQAATTEARLATVVDHHLAARRGKLAAERIVDAIALCLPSPNEDAAARWSVGPQFRPDRTMLPQQINKMSATRADIESQLTEFRLTLDCFNGLRVTELGRSLFHIGH